MESRMNPTHIFPKIIEHVWILNPFIFDAYSLPEELTRRVTIVGI
jgi:hypothetical protein